MKVNFYQIVLDEAQKIKNSDTKVYQSSMMLQGSHRLILSGTPVENKLEDLWSLINFVQPGLLGPLQYFVKDYCHQIMKGSDCKADDVDKMAASKMTVEIHRRLKNHILRRTKQGL